MFHRCFTVLTIRLLASRPRGGAPAKVYQRLSPRLNLKKLLHEVCVWHGVSGMADPVA